MSRNEFARVMSYVGIATGKPLTTDALEVYFDLLGELDYSVLMLGCKRVLLEHRWATFPTVAELRQAAIETSRGEMNELTEAEAWAMAWRIVGDTDPEVEGSFSRACKRAKAPDRVIEAIKAMGVNAMCYGEEPIGVVRGQFLKAYSQLAGRDRRRALMPPAMRDAIEDMAKPLPPAKLPELTAGIGAMPQ